MAEETEREPAPSFVDYLDMTNRLFGEGEPTKPEMPLLPTLPAPNSNASNLPNYMAVAKDFRLRADAFVAIQDKVIDKVGKETAENVTMAGRKNIRALIDSVNSSIVGATDDATFIEYLGMAFEAVDGVRQAVTDEAGKQGDDLRQMVLDEIAASDKRAADRQAETNKMIADALGKYQITPPAGPGTPGAPGAPGANNPGQNPPPWLNDNGPKQPGTTPDPTRPGTITPPGTTPPGTTKPPTTGVKPPVSDIKPPTTTPPISTPPRVNPPISSPSSPGLGGMPGMGMPGMGFPGMGMGMPGMGMGLPGMNDQMARRAELDRDLARRREELEDRRDRDRPRDVVPPRSAAQPAVAQQGAGAPGGANGQQVNANSGVTATTGAGTPPPPGQAAGPVPNDKGLVEYDKFKHLGRPSLWVSPVVYGALDAAVANKKGIDAKAAYANTPAKWNDDKKIGLRVDPVNLIPGDVVSFKDGTAIVVVWKPGEAGAGAVPAADGAAPAAGAEGNLEIIANGELQALTGDIMKAEGPYGEFIGFFHPNGIDAVPPADAGAAAPAPATADQQPTVVA